ncbi:cell envelope integrity protein CreD [Trabulsiella odontotermitis]|uniref:cell envelope integrity protein CreD n=1 Tax=Trabulsiella odontotermitis TaxID=379893 RepID=UPI0024B8441C|nr:cell envelope integrity protein CreD [Trabulsiella odontotermitis]WHP30681.1 cell envelope integrity protein CreD [Trabulsiella odontotermitis]
MFKSPLFFKIATLIGCVGLLLVPLMMVSDLVAERASYRSLVEDSLRQSTSGPQKLIGPMIAVPTTEIYTVVEDDKNVLRKRMYFRYWLPESLTVEGQQNVESREIGIYEGQIWHTTLTVNAQFDRSKLDALMKAEENVTLGEPFLVMSVGDSRGIGVVEAPELNGIPATVEPGSGIHGDLPGLHIPLSTAMLDARTLSLSMTLNLNGTGSFSVVPVGRNSELALTSNWPHPGFLGDFLPVQREITDKGFSARWQSSWFATDLGSQFNRGYRVAWDELPAFKVSVATPADQYQLTDRATKYAILLIALTFMAFFVFETLTALRLHPMQYLLVGLSLVMFYLVLLALSEHIGFTPAWIAASLTGAFINGIYLQAVLKGWRNSLLFTVALLALDGVMWVLLRSEDSALLLGTGVLLVALSAVMFLTRHFDWYSLSKPKAKPIVPEGDELRVWK